MSDVEGLTTEERASLWAALIDSSDPWGLERAVESILAARVQAARAEALEEAADGMEVGVARSAVITERAECHKRQCSCGHPSEDRLVGLIANRFRDALRARAAALRADDAGGEGL